MVKRTVGAEIMKIVKAYTTEVSKHYKIDYAFLFGSFAKGTQHKDSDIDIAIISKDIKNSFFDGVAIGKLRWNIDLRIEPHAINTDDYRNNTTAITDEIIRTGIRI
jgi:predicted nucleotidyltransferase